MIVSSGSGGHTGGTRPGQTWKKPKDLSEREREERGCGEGVEKCISIMDLYLIRMVRSVETKRMRGTKEKMRTKEKLVFGFCLFAYLLHAVLIHIVRDLWTTGWQSLHVKRHIISSGGGFAFSLVMTPVSFKLRVLVIIYTSNSSQIAEVAIIYGTGFLFWTTVQTPWWGVCS